MQFYIWTYNIELCLDSYVSVIFLIIELIISYSLKVMIHHFPILWLFRMVQLKNMFSE